MVCSQHSLLPKFLVFCSLRIYPHLQDMGGFFVAVLQMRPSTSLENDDSNPLEVLKLMKRVGSPDVDSRGSGVKRPKVCAIG